MPSSTFPTSTCWICWCGITWPGPARACVVRTNWSSHWWPRETCLLAKTGRSFSRWWASWSAASFRATARWQKRARSRFRVRRIAIPSCLCCSTSTPRATPCQTWFCRRTSVLPAAWRSPRPTSMPRLQAMPVASVRSPRASGRQRAAFPRMHWCCWRKKVFNGPQPAKAYSATVCTALTAKHPCPTANSTCIGPIGCRTAAMKLPASSAMICCPTRSVSSIPNGMATKRSRISSWLWNVSVASRTLRYRLWSA